jgi:glycosyltransferase involved in cell wall biosynthesis
VAPTGVSTPAYVLITPARDEERKLGNTIASVLAQDVPPRHWVIVDDGSVDGTARVARELAGGDQRVTIISRPAGAPANFASKVSAFAAGLEALGGVPYDFIGNLDADVSFASDYFARLLERFTARPRLGLAGGLIVQEVGDRSQPQRISPNSVAGAVQLFRRACFDDVGGLRPLSLGGEDAAAEILARMHGWEVQTFFDLRVHHHGPVHNRKRGAYAAFFARGVVNRTLGYDPLFQIFVSGYRTAQPPYLLGGALMLAGYLYAAAQGKELALPAEAVAFLRREQRQRLRQLMRHT